MLDKPTDTSNKPLCLVLLADRKDHGRAGNGVHDYPLWQERWALLLGGRAASSATQVNLHGRPIKHDDATKGADNVTVERAEGQPRAHRLVVGDHSSVELL